MSPHYLVKIPKSDFSSISLRGFEYFGYLLTKRTQCQSAAEIITVYLFSRLFLPAMTSRKCLKKKCAQQLTEANRSSCLERSQALLDKFSEHEVEFIFCEENGITSV